MKFTVKAAVNFKNINSIMKKPITAIIFLLTILSCGQSKENREEFKGKHDKDFLRNKLGDSAVANSEMSSVSSDSSSISREPVESPTNYKKNNKPNTAVGGSR